MNRSYCTASTRAADPSAGDTDPDPTGSVKSNLSFFSHIAGLKLYVIDITVDFSN